MAIGGKREGAGRKSEWNHTPTKMMGRFPTEFEPQIREYVKLLDSESDSGASGIDSETKSKRDEMTEQINAVLVTLRPSDRRAAKKLLWKLGDRLLEN